MRSEPLRLRVTQRPAPSGKGRVLMVDEDPKDLGLYRSALEAEGFQVITSTSFEEGDRCLEKETFDFVLVSQGSTAFEGRTVLDHALKTDRGRPVLVITRCTDIRCYLEAMQMGAVDYVEKPVAPSDLLHVVEAHVQHGRVQQLGGGAS